MTDVNSIQYQSTSSHLADETNNSFILNQSNVPMDIDDDDDDDHHHHHHGLISNGLPKVNGHFSPTSSSHPIENEIEQNNEEKEDFYHQG